MTSQYVKKHVRKSGSERREEILDATLKIISEHGVEGTTIARIAAAVGLTPGAIYRHFQSRGALIAEANKLASEQALRWVQSVTAPNVLEQLEAIGEAHTTWAQENFTSVVRPFFLELASAPGPDIAEKDKLGFASFKSFQALVDMVKEGQQQGTLRPDIPPEEIAWALHMFAWAEDIALMADAKEFVDNGTFLRILRRLLATYRAGDFSG